MGGGGSWQEDRDPQPKQGPHRQVYDHRGPHGNKEEHIGERGVHCYRGAMAIGGGRSPRKDHTTEGA